MSSWLLGHLFTRRQYIEDTWATQLLWVWSQQSALTPSVRHFYPWTLDSVKYSLRSLSLTFYITSPWISRKSLFKKTLCVPLVFCVKALISLSANFQLCTVLMNWICEAISREEILSLSRNVLMHTGQIHARRVCKWFIFFNLVPSLNQFKLRGVTFFHDSQFWMRTQRGITTSEINLSSDKFLPLTAWTRFPPGFCIGHISDTSSHKDDFDSPWLFKSAGWALWSWSDVVKS